MHTFTPAQRDWVDTLRSGKYPQAKEVLTALNYDGSVQGHCCLGVGAERAVIAGLVRAEISNDGTCRNYVDTDGWTDTSLLDGLTQTYLGLRTNCGTLRNLKNRDDLPESLSDLNDAAGLTFDQIADVVEYFAEDLFEPTQPGDEFIPCAE